MTMKDKHNQHTPSVPIRRRNEYPMSFMIHDKLVTSKQHRQALQTWVLLATSLHKALFVCQLFIYPKCMYPHG